MHIIHINVYIYTHTYIQSSGRTYTKFQWWGRRVLLSHSSVIFEYLQEECFNSYHFKVLKYIPIASHLLRGKESACNAGDTGDAGLIPGSGRFPRGGNGKPLLYSYLENAMDREAWWAAVHKVAESWTQLSTHIFYWVFLL